MKRISTFMLGEKFELEIEDEFYEFIKDDLLKLQNSTPKDFLFLFLKNKKELFQSYKQLEELLEKLSRDK